MDGGWPFETPVEKAPEKKKAQKGFSRKLCGRFFDRLQNRVGPITTIDSGGNSLIFVHKRQTLW